jgi:hypothetical protein
MISVNENRTAYINIRIYIIIYCNRVNNINITLIVYKQLTDKLSK